MRMGSLSSQYDWKLRHSSSMSEGSRYRDPEIEVRPMNKNMIEVRVIDMNTGRRYAKMFDLSLLGMYSGMSAGIASMGMNACLADFPSSDNKSVSRELLKLFL